MICETVTWFLSPQVRRVLDSCTYVSALALSHTSGVWINTWKSSHAEAPFTRERSSGNCVVFHFRKVARSDGDVSKSSVLIVYIGIWNLFSKSSIFRNWKRCFHVSWVTCESNSSFSYCSVWSWFMMSSWDDVMTIIYLIYAAAAAAVCDWLMILNQFDPHWHRNSCSPGWPCASSCFLSSLYLQVWVCVWVGRSSWSSEKGITQPAVLVSSPAHHFIAHLCF